MPLFHLQNVSFSYADVPGRSGVSLTVGESEPLASAADAHGPHASVCEAPAVDEPVADL